MTSTYFSLINVNKNFTTIINGISVKVTISSIPTLHEYCMSTADRFTELSFSQLIKVLLCEFFNY